MAEWADADELNEGKGYVCGYCGNQVGSNTGYTRNVDTGYEILNEYIYICPCCGRPTYVDDASYCYPSPIYGENVLELPDDVKTLYNEARSCMQVNAYTACVLCGRKLLMNTCVSLGDEEGKKFIEYVDFLKNNHYLPPNSDKWVDKIRKLGNEATHSIEHKTEAEAKLVLDFLGMIFKIIYEFPNRA